MALEYWRLRNRMGRKHTGEDDEDGWMITGLGKDNMAKNQKTGRRQARVSRKVLTPAIGEFGDIFQGIEATGPLR